MACSIGTASSIADVSARLAGERPRQGPISDDLRNRIIEMFEQTPPRRVPRERVALIIASLRETPQDRYSDGGLNPNP